MNKTISLIVLASAAVHAAVLGLIDFNAPVEIPVGSLMRVSIQASLPASLEKTRIDDTVPKRSVPQPSTTVMPTKPAIKPALKKNTTEATNNIAAPITATQTNDTPPIETATKQPQTVVAKLENISPSIEQPLPKSTSSLLHSDLERAFALHFYYPRIAIKRGWQGEVKISLRVEANGHLTRVRLLNSSGYTLLDNAAMTSIDKVEILPAAIALLGGQSLDLVLPVEYHLL